MYKLYVDGSFMNNRCGSGWVLVDDSNKVVKDFSTRLQSDYGMRQVTGEIYALLDGLEYCLNNGINDIKVYFDYLGVRNWITGEWKAKNSYTKQYAEIGRFLVSSMNIEFIKVKSHSGDYFNDLADRLAKGACM